MRTRHYTYCLLLLLLVFSMRVAAQDSLTSGPSVVQDPRVDELVRKHILINTTLSTMDGFRVQVFSDSGPNSKTKAQSMHDEILSKFPGTGVYLSFKSPNYKVRVGDFRTRLDAQRFLIGIIADYPNAFIIADQINLPKSDP